MLPVEFGSILHSGPLCHSHFGSNCWPVCTNLPKTPPPPPFSYFSSLLLTGSKTKFCISLFKQCIIAKARVYLLYSSMRVLRLIQIVAFILRLSRGTVARLSFQCDHCYILEETALKDWVLLCDIYSTAHLPFRAEWYKDNYPEDGGKESIPCVLKVNSLSIH